MARKFEIKEARRESVPLLVGLYGPSGSGKTWSALRLATGIQKLSGGPIFAVDTESRRMLHYADKFSFNHLQFDAPFSPLDYLAAIRCCVDQGAKTIIIDSMSLEHEGQGGVLEMHDEEAQRLAKQWNAPVSAANFAAWGKPKAERRRLLNEILQMNCNFIFCFRAKEKVKQRKKEEIKRGEDQLVQLGWMPIAGEEYVYEMVLNALLLPGAKGVPSWHSDEVGSNAVIKLPEQFKSLLEKRRPFDEEIGYELAKWAAGDGGQKTQPSHEESVAKAIGYFSEKGIDKPRLFSHIGVASESQIDPNGLAVLRSLVAKSKDTSIDELIPKLETKTDA